MAAPIRILAIAILLSVVGAARAGFVPATWDLHQPSDPIQESFVYLYPDNSGPHTFQPLTFPNVSNISAVGIAPVGGQATQIDATVSFLPNFLGMALTSVEIGPGAASGLVQGAFVFTVNDSVHTVASGNLHLPMSGQYSDNGLWARLFDYTTQEFLFQSSQYDFGRDMTYALGELVGNRTASFSGSLENTLQSGHIYRFDFLIQSVSGSVGAFSLSATSTVPEPGTLALLAVGLAGLGWSRHRPIAKGRYCGVVL